MLLSAEVQAVVDTLNQTPISLTDLPLDQARSEYVKLLVRSGGEPAPIARVEDHRLMLGDRKLAIRCYRPQGLTDHPAPTLVYYHGGGWVLGDLESHDRVCRQIARRAQCQLIAIDYRRAPEHPLPAASEDAIATLEHLATHASEFGIDTKRLAVGGDSAGGHLSAVAALAARDTARPLALQVLIYPVTDLRPAARQYPSRLRNGAYPPLTSELMRWFGRFSGKPEVDPGDWRLSPLLAASMEGTAPALVITAGADILMDDGVLYAARLRDDGIDVEHAHYPGVIHGFIEMHDWLSVTGQAMDRIADALRKAFGS